MRRKRRRISRDTIRRVKDWDGDKRRRVEE